jgi:hypothetical protein
MFDVIFFYPHPDFVCDVLVTTIAESQIDQLWELAKTEDPSLANHIGEAECIFYIVCSYFLHHKWVFSYIL